MLRLILAAVLAVIAMPAPAATYIKYEGSGSGQLTEYGAETRFSLVDINFVAYVPIDGNCNLGFKCSVRGNRLTLEDVRSYTWAYLDFDHTLNGLPISAEGLTGGQALGGRSGYEVWTGSINWLNVSLVASPPPGAEYGAITVSYTPVPEPAAWALMIAGFGLLGGALRRHGSAARRASSASIHAISAST